MLLTAAIERSLAASPSLLRNVLPPAMRPLAIVLGALAGPWARVWAGAVGGALRSAKPLQPAALSWIRPVWLELGRYCGWIAGG